MEDGSEEDGAGLYDDPLALVRYLRARSFNPGRDHAFFEKSRRKLAGAGMSRKRRL